MKDSREVARLLLLWCVLLVSGLLGCKPGTGSESQSMPVVQVIALPPQIESVTEKLSLIGSMAANEMVEIRSETEGIALHILFDEGQKVSKNDMLIQLDARELQSMLEESQANLKAAEAQYIRNKELLADDLVSKQDFDVISARYEATKALVQIQTKRLDETQIRAPFDGVTGERRVSPGQVITPATVLTWLVNLDPIKVEFNVPEKFLGAVKIGQTSELKVAAFPNETFIGEVYFIAPFVDPLTRTALVKARVPNPDSRLIPGMFANLDLNLTIREEALVIPEAAISQILTENEAVVFVVDNESNAQMRTVKVGLRLPGRIEILSGLEASDQVIVEGLQKIGPGSKVTLAPAESANPYLKENLQP